MIDLEGLEKLAARLRQIVKSYEAKNPLRTADFHGEDCSCYRCAVDACDAAVNALPELLAERDRLREALCIETKGSLTWWVDRAAQYAEDMGEEGFLIDRDHWERIVFAAQTEAAHATLKETGQ